MIEVLSDEKNRSPSLLITCWDPCHWTGSGAFPPPLVGWQIFSFLPLIKEGKGSLSILWILGREGHS